MVDYELIPPFVYLRPILQDLSTSGNREGGSEQIREGALLQTALLVVFVFLEPEPLLKGRYSNLRGALKKSYPEPHFIVERQFISMLRHEHREKRQKCSLTEQERLERIFTLAITNFL